MHQTKETTPYLPHPTMLLTAIAGQGDDPLPTTSTMLPLYLLCLLPEVVDVRVHQTKERVLRDKEVRGEKRKGGGAIVERGRGCRCDLFVQTLLDSTDSYSEWKCHNNILLCNICTGVNITRLSF